MPVDCKQLAVLSKWGEISIAIREQTNFEQDKLIVCRAEICGSIFGIQGNPDISGIGVIASYVLELVLGTIISGFHFGFSSLIRARQNRGLRQTPRLKRVADVYYVAFEIFFASAVYFALALELAILVSLGKWNSDMHEQGYSIFESRMSGVVSILCILPLLYPVTRTGPLIPEDRRLLRNVLFIFAVVISTYPFVAQTIQNWDPWPDVFQGWEWEAIQKTCFSPLHGVRPRRIVEISSIIAGIVIHSVAAAILVDMLLNIPIPGLSEKTGMLWNSVRKMRCFRKFIKKLHERHYFYYFIRVFALLLPIILAIPLLWEIFRLRKAQKEMAQVTGQMYQGDSWGFGQIVAVVIFLPILIELFQDLGTGVEDGEGRNGTR